MLPHVASASCDGSCRCQRPGSNRGLDAPTMWTTDHADCCLSRCACAVRTVRVRGDQLPRCWDLGGRRTGARTDLQLLLCDPQAVEAVRNADREAQARCRLARERPGVEEPDLARARAVRAAQWGHRGSRRVLAVRPGCGRGLAWFRVSRARLHLGLARALVDEVGREVAVIGARACIRQAI